MYEITHKGAWFRWNALDRREKWLAAVSVIASLPASAVAGIHSGDSGYRVGHWLGSGGSWPDETGAQHIIASPLFPPFVAFAFVCAVVSAVAWWLFSRRQDEMFNRAQNEAIGRAGAWTVGIVGAWWMLSLPGWVAPVSGGWVLAVALTLVLAFWFRAVRRWA